MATRGRKPDPPKLRIAKVNEGSTAGPFAAVRAGGAPPKPPTIADDPEASAEWDRVVDLLAEREVLSPADMGIMMDYCLAHSLVVQIRAELRGRPLTVTNEESGAMKAHPLLAALNVAMTKHASFAQTLGLTPTERGRIKTIEDATGGSPLQRLNSGVSEARSRYVRSPAEPG